MPPQNSLRDMRNTRNQEEEPIRPPFPENYVVDEEEPTENEIHLFEELDSEIYVTEKNIICLHKKMVMMILRRNQSSIRGVIYMLWIVYKGRLG